MKQRSLARSSRAGFTLIELLMAAGVLAGILHMLPAVQRVREAANRQSAERNLRQIAAAMGDAYQQTGKLTFDDPGAARDGYRIAIAENSGKRVRLVSEPTPGVTGAMTGILEVSIAPWGVDAQLQFVPTPGADAGRKRMLAEAYDAAARMYGRLFQRALPAVQRDALKTVRAYVESPLTAQGTPLSLVSAREQALRLANGSEFWLEFSRALQLGAKGENWTALPGLSALPAVQNEGRLLNFSNIAGFVRRTMADAAAGQKVAGFLELGAASEAVAEMRRLQSGATVGFFDTEAAILLAGSM